MAFLTQAFVDESGGVDLPHFVIGGMLGSTEMWKAFSDDWQKVLDEVPAIPPLHMVDIYGRKNGFQVLNKAARDARLMRLIDVVACHKPLRFYTFFEVDEFKNVFRGAFARDSKNLKHPYAVAAVDLVTRLLVNIEKHVPGAGSVELLFDTHQQCGPRLERIITRDLYEVVKNVNPKDAELIGGVRWIRHHERQNYTPIQAADMLVWNVRRALSHPGWSDSEHFKTLINSSEVLIHKITEDHLREMWKAGTRPD